MQFLSPPLPLYFSIQSDDGQSTERDSRTEAERVYQRWCESHPDRRIWLVQIYGVTIDEHRPVRKLDVPA